MKNELFIEVSGAGLPEVDGLFVPSLAPPTVSESGTESSLGYWNGKLAWDRADGRAARSPSLSYSNSYQSWRISRLDGHLAYHITCTDDLPPTDREWEVYKMGAAPAPRVTIHYCDPGLPCPSPNVVFVMGGPGAGKGTMCELAELQLGWVHLSTGDLLRQEIAAGGPQASAIEEDIKNGRLVSDQITVQLLQAAMERTTRTTGKRNFLLDGFPRSVSNLDVWQEVFGCEMALPKMLHFECPLTELERRIMGRSPYSGRSDDNLESIRLRFETYKVETMPTVDYFLSHGKCELIDTSLNRQAVFELVVAQLAEFTSHEHSSQPLTERSEILLGLRPYPRPAQESS
ncbi:MAG: nucleoside monophosphate kinase [Pirellulaceae bacterium]|nr:nucleoside monophosphate kinase [Pirellulaceae bacterium]